MESCLTVCNKFYSDFDVWMFHFAGLLRQMFAAAKEQVSQT